MGFFNKKAQKDNDKIVVDMTMGGTLKSSFVMKEEKIETMSLEEWIEMRRKEQEKANERTDS